MNNFYRDPAVFIKKCDLIYKNHKMEFVNYLNRLPGENDFESLEYIVHFLEDTFASRVYKIITCKFGFRPLFSSPNNFIDEIKKLLGNNYYSPIIEFLENIVYSNKRKKSESLPSTILRHLPLYIEVKDRNNYTIYINEIERQRKVMRTYSQLSRTYEYNEKDYLEEVTILGNEVLTSGEKINFEEFLIDESGKEYIFSTCIHPFKNLQNDILGTIYLTEDISERTRKEDELKRHLEDLVATNDSVEDVAGEFNLLNIELNNTIEALNSSNAQKDRLFSIIGHDLKNPAGAIKNFLEALHEDYDDMEESEKRDFIKYSYESSERLVKLLLDLLEWGRLSRGQIKIEFREIELNAIILDIFGLLESNARQKDISLFTDIKNISILCDPNMLNTVIRNLVNNAIKFTPRGGTISITYDLSDNYHLISVKDTGVGISEDYIEDIFKVDKVTTSPGTEQEQGTGLGLPICKEFVEKCGGEIFVKSKLNKGSIFTIKLPS